MSGERCFTVRLEWEDVQSLLGVGERGVLQGAHRTLTRRLVVFITPPVWEREESHIP
jgi:hypothetical protein